MLEAQLEVGEIACAGEGVGGSKGAKDVHQRWPKKVSIMDFMALHYNKKIVDDSHESVRWQVAPLLSSSVCMLCCKFMCLPCNHWRSSCPRVHFVICTTIKLRLLTLNSTSLNSSGAQLQMPYS